MLSIAQKVSLNKSAQSPHNHIFYYYKNNIYKIDNENDVYYYKDKDCTKKIKGLFKSKKSKIIKYGTDIQEQPYMITSNNYI